MGMVLPLDRLDVYSRYILTWKLSPTMNADDVEKTLLMAPKKSG